MSTFSIIKKNKREDSFRTRSVIDRFELKIENEDFYISGEINLEDKQWNVGLIVGGSGTGKSTIAKEVFSNYYIENLIYSDSKAVIDEMPKNKTIEQIGEMFNSVGFGTIWSWLKPYSVLSTGEKMRVDLARCLLEDREIIVFDEFTSVVDRDIAKIASACISKKVKKDNKKFIAVSCHKDILDWLEPDWIYDTDKQQFFFAQIHIKGQKLNLKLLEQIEPIGNFLKNITI